MKKILVLGGTGNIGFPLIEELSKNTTIPIKAGVRDPKKAEKMFADFPNTELCAFDFLDEGTFPKAMEDVDKVFFVRPPQLSKPQEDMLPFLTYAKMSEISQIVFVSLIGVEKNPVTPHHKIEKMIKELQIPYTFIRPSFFMQNLNTTHREDIQKHHDLFIPAGKAKTSFIDTRDIGAVAAICLTNEQYLNKELEITGSEALTYYQIADIMTAVLNTTITYSKPGLLKFRKTMIKRGIPKDYANVMTMLYLITQLGNAKKVTSTTEEVLGRKPISFETYTEDYREYFVG